MKFLNFASRHPLFAIFYLSAGIFGFSQNSFSETIPPVPTFSPIEVHFATLSGIRYIQDDRLLGGKDLREIIFPLHDPEATRLLKKSNDSGSLGGIGLILGLGVMTGGIVAATNNVTDENNVRAGLGVALGGLFLLGTGALFNSEGKTTEFNAVERYNHVVWAADKTPLTKEHESDPAKIHPIDMRLTTLGGFIYSVDGNELARFEDVKTRIDSLNDFEASRLIKKSESSDLISKILLLLGAGGEIATLALNSNSNNTGDRTGFWFPLIGSLLAMETGTFFQMEANTTKFNAVKRYNRFAKGQEEVLPKTPDDKTLMNFLAPVGPTIKK